MSGSPPEWDHVLKVLEATFGFAGFKSAEQEAAVRAVLHGGQDVFVCFPTGGGKSLTYQLPAVVLGGVTLVISPLLALIEDQVTALQSLGVHAATINSRTPRAERFDLLQQLRARPCPLRLLYLTPETLQTDEMQQLIQALYDDSVLRLMAVDEAHCVSEWGHDFRPAFRRLAVLRRLCPTTPVMALTATAQAQVQSDIITTLKLRNPAVVRRSTYRDNLTLEVRMKDMYPNLMGDITTFIEAQHEAATARGQAASGIIYAFRREDCEAVAGAVQRHLTRAGIRCAAYHAGLNAEERNRIQHEWTVGHIHVVAATIAFGMGIDKANVRYVVHATMSKSLEAYYQEAGRAGRDGQPAVCRLYYAQSDMSLFQYLQQKEAKSRQNKEQPDRGDHLRHMQHYCLAATCRHAVIARHFGEALSPCQTRCDCCREPESVQKQLRCVAGPSLSPLSLSTS
ncbi:uncharacterized protein MONBRDRAFT_15227 [Monosiga brevicollis MX1]|uniref:ATP-dependent DNA helicase n=1 Tax=Monosiga brevicollis TaxID=81824 RepID=A9USY2_MONBE|nr:uncharacterized protein MONBRDRAFT_15227 [Monosiga brevicollis MX1]EDQ91401.1 predicted protein [Monosiga brevicollis MX1]|eukprot:XP_001743823.1 hypothetical protein [Monosiga brevicollis MX1]